MSIKDFGWRRSLGAFAFTAAGALLTTSYYVHDLQPCDDIVARVGQVPLINSCRPLQWNDGPILFLALVGLAFFTPDLARFELFGLLSIERKIDSVEQETRALRSDLVQIRQNIHVVQVQQPLPTNADLQSVLEALNVKASEFQAPEPSESESAE